MEETLQKLQVDNVKLQAELGHEKQRAEMLQKDLQDSQRVGRADFLRKNSMCWTLRLSGK